jgi:Rho GDP-dissociation inhibitor
LSFFSSIHICPLPLSVAADDDRRVVILELRVICENRPDGDIVYTLDDAASLKAMKKNPFTLKEGCKYKLQVTFRVQHKIVSGLKYKNAVKKKFVTGRLS